ncbi:hypothetical protein COU14_01520 [Candidatus Kaiserbacteria bacterium CG10_big_fil_rev_8_21_14_0_10_44_10]|uniref:Methyltransferase FkbM domain-containing protein n=1 Tax=Candidatus Kaiserbacteria bacterium CG10_big_fil_rev_8_21_14_0_10_44_10 TaxID=1974606 RepID=A0A2H0UHR4_9BACT|nr:MAG: hypothetical protein COU14_01520 [Candidatus Kaiserbacteria bacterium CG10_big_fil_rev_8_21_14_0_10_44_10]
MRKIFFIVTSWFKKLTGKQLFYITPNSHNSLGKTAVRCDVGFWYVGNVYDSTDIAYGIAQNGVVEKEDTNLVLKILSQINFPVVYDIGANTGYYGILAATKFNATVHSFEPIPEHVVCIKESARLNGTQDKVTTHTVALGNKEDILELSLAGSGSTLTTDFLGEVSLPSLKVTVKTLDSLDLPAPHFIKIDVEGYEWEVLQGAKETIKKYKPICFIEIAKKFPERKFIHPHFTEIIKFFHDQDYKVERNAAEGLVDLEDIPDGVSMYLCTPK